MQRWEMQFSKGWWGREWKKNEVLLHTFKSDFFFRYGAVWALYVFWILTLIRHIICKYLLLLSRLSVLLMVSSALEKLLHSVRCHWLFVFVSLAWGDRLYICIEIYRDMYIAKTYLCQTVSYLCFLLELLWFLVSDLI